MLNLFCNACPLFGLVLWLGYLGCSGMGDWGSLYFLASLQSASVSSSIIILWDSEYWQ